MLSAMLYLCQQNTWEVLVMKDLNKLGKVITKILEVFHWIGQLEWGSPLLASLLQITA